MKPWALYSVSDLKYTVSKMKNTGKSRFFQKFFSEKLKKPNFLKISAEDVAKDAAQLLAETWCPHLLWALRNLPHKFEKLAQHEICEKNVTIWAPRKARAPKT